jgi:hypothetical protein
MYEAFGLFLDGIYYPGMAVTGSAHCYAGSEIQKGVAVGVMDPQALAFLGNKRIDSSVRGRHMFGVNPD